MQKNESGGANRSERAAFHALFAADWLLRRGASPKAVERRERFERRLLARASTGPEGKILPVDRRRDLSAEEFHDRYFVTGVPVVLEGAAAQWPAITKWTPQYLASLCGDEEIEVLDGVNWTVNRNAVREAVSTTDTRLRMRDLLAQTSSGTSWYGAFLEILNSRADLRADLDLSFVEKFGHTRRALPWQRNVLAKMYVGGPATATSLHCAGVSNLYVQIQGRKKWVLIPPRFTPYMYLAFSNGLNWQSRVDFRDPDYDACPLYRYVDRHETVLEPGDVLWNPPFVWHGVANLTESIAVSLWWINVVRAFSSNFVLSALTLCGRPNPIALQLGISRAANQSGFNVHLNR